jgi:hypothetical protein
VAEVRGVPQAHTYGRTLARTKEHLRDALAVFLDVPIEAVDIVVHIEGIGDATALVDAAIRTRQQAEQLAAEARQIQSLAGQPPSGSRLGGWIGLTRAAAIS